MMRLVILFVLGALLCAGVPTQAGETASDLLEKAIFTEESAGDMDGAIALYQQVIDSSESARAALAQAHYRLALCRLKRGEYAEAMQLFDMVINRFSDQTEIVEQARQQVPAEVTQIAAPWLDGELLRLRIQTGAGLEIGTFVQHVTATSVDGKQAWRIEDRQFVKGSPLNLQSSRIDVEQESFAPIHASMRHTQLGWRETTYAANSVENVIRGVNGAAQTATTIVTSSPVYDNQQALHLIRRLPLREGYQGAFSVVSFGAQAIPIRIRVSATEQVSVPAGSFECFKVELLSLGQTVWVSTDAHRYLVKLAAGAITMQLAAIENRAAGSSDTYINSEFGYSLSLPPDWMHYALPGENADRDTVVLLDPEGRGFYRLGANRLRDGDPKTPRQVADMAVKKSTRDFEGFKVRPDSWQERTIQGRAAVSFVADYTESGKPCMFYATAIVEGSLSAYFVSRFTPDAESQNRQTMEAILSGYQTH